MNHPVEFSVTKNIYPIVFSFVCYIGVCVFPSPILLVTIVLEIQTLLDNQSNVLVDMG